MSQTTHIMIRRIETSLSLLIGLPRGAHHA
nr:MAG TPA: hypothetical protein [Caudoviricetes sp.]DAK97698.1 MAG TPA: hypothetical protein [Caudoviricetes sp.]DAQ30061.1 MAG TPA: hypothetical protein [Caudoviricetes sp.]DAR78641.1 MAG TPA: hypothetical protein [Caudoviricetes sp.]DAS59994.1 MAG TPA: hypothetical protein [Caudoviricetes sp.]